MQPTRAIDFETDEGTWMSVDVSPDGRTLVFDMLGDIYTLAVTGGEARRITPVGLAVSSRPRWSPDGRRIAYISDATGTEEAWVMNADGSHAHAVTASDPVALKTVSFSTTTSPMPVWARDGASLVAGYKKKFTSALARVGLEHGPAGIGPAALFGREDCNVTDAAVAAGAIYVLCRDVRNDIDMKRRRVTRIDPATGTAVRTVALGREDVLGIEVSAGGGFLVYATPDESDPAASLLWRHDLAGDGAPDVRIAKIALVTDERQLVQFPGFAVTPDERAVIVASGGKLTRIDIASGKAAVIPFRAKVHKVLGPLTRREHRLDDGLIAVRQILEPDIAPDASAMVFGAVGKVWLQEKGGKPRRLTGRALTDPLIEFDPVYSPDGKQVAFTTWSRATGGQLWTVPAAGGTPRALLSGPQDPGGAVGVPRWSPDGKRIAFLTAEVTFKPAETYELPRGTTTMNFEYQFSADAAIGLVDATGGDARQIAAPGLEFSERGGQGVSRDLSFSSDGRRLAYWSFDTEQTAGPFNLPPLSLHTIDIGGQGTHVVFGKFAGLYLRGALSPAGNWLAIEQTDNIFLLPADAIEASRGELIGMGGNCRWRPSCVSTRLDPRAIRVTREGGHAPNWSADGQWLSWHQGNRVYRERIDRLAAGDRDQQAPFMTAELSVVRALPAKPLLLAGARVITVSGETIERGDILVEGRRIVAVGHAGSLDVPSGAMRLDLAGRTVVPGFIGIQESTVESSSMTPFTDVHHGPGLAYGVATAWTPGVGNQFDLSQEEARQAGAIAGKREVTSGCRNLMTGSSDMGSAQEMVDTLASCATLDTSTMPELYAYPTRLQRQWAVMAAGTLGIALATESGSYLTKVSELLDGFALLEHDYNGVRYYRDALELWSRAGSLWHVNGNYYNTTFNIRNLRRAGGLSGYSEEGPFLEEQRDGKTYQVGYGPAGKMPFFLERDDDLKPLEALAMLTLDPARGLGLGRDLGSIEQGKIADLVILGDNPLTNPRAVIDTVQYVVQDGFVYQVGADKKMTRVN